MSIADGLNFLFDITALSAALGAFHMFARIFRLDMEKGEWLNVLCACH